MRGPGPLGGLGLLGLFLVGQAPARAEPDRAPPAVAPKASSETAARGWDALDRLDRFHGFPASPGLWTEVGLRAWEALPEVVEGRLRGGFEPRRGLGFQLSCIQLEAGDAPSARVLGMAGVLRVDRARFELGAEETRFAGGKLRTGWTRFLVSLFPGWILGGTLEGAPGLPGGAASVTPEIWGGSGSWRAGLSLRDRAEATLGLLVRPGLAVWARYEGGTAGVGIALGGSGASLRAEAADHAYLGRVAQVRLRVRGGGEP